MVRRLARALHGKSRHAARAEGTWVCPEGAACFAAVAQLRAAGWLTEADEVVVVNTGAGLKYPQTMPAHLELLRADGRIPPPMPPSPATR